MRTRIDNAPDAYTANTSVPFTFLNNGVFWFGGESPGGPRLISRSRKEITDEVSPISSRRPVRYCHHVKEDFSALHPTMIAHSGVDGADNWTATYSGENSIFALAGSSAQWAPSLGEISHQGITLSFPRSVDELYRAASHKFFNMNEVDNLQTLLDNPAGLLTSLYSLNARFRRAFGRTKRPDFNREMRQYGLFLSGGYLYYSFVIAPLFRDLQRMVDICRNLNADILRWKKEHGKPVRYSASCRGSLSLNLPSSSPWIPVSGGGSRLLLPLVAEDYPPTRRVVIHGKHNLPYKSETFKRFQYFIDRFGAPGPATLAWELIPFTFVVDWFFDLAGVLDNIDNALTGMRHEIIDRCWSERFSVTVNNKLIVADGYTRSSPHDNQIVSTNKITYYHREPLEHASLAGLSGRFGKKQLGLAVALLYQIVANLKRFR